MFNFKTKKTSNQNSTHSSGNSGFANKAFLIGALAIMPFVVSAQANAGAPSEKPPANAPGKSGSSRQDTLQVLAWELKEGMLTVHAPGTRFGGGSGSISTYVKGMADSSAPSASDVRKTVCSFQEGVGPCIYLFFDRGVIQISIDKYSGKLKICGTRASEGALKDQYFIASNGAFYAFTDKEIIAILSTGGFLSQSPKFDFSGKLDFEDSDSANIIVKTGTGAILKVTKTDPSSLCPVIIFN